MQIRTLLTTLALSGVALSAAPREEQLKSSDHKKIGKDVAAYWQAREETKGIAKAFQELSETIDKIDASKFKKQGGTILAAIDDWEAIFWYASEELLDKPKTGKVTVDDTEDPPFSYYVAKSYKSSKGPYPLVLVVPDEGEDPEALLDELSGTDLGSSAVLAAVHPQGSAADWSGDAGVIEVMTAFGRVARSNQFGFDYDRVFLLGKGQGFTAAATTARYLPHLFAGLIALGDTPTVDPTNFRSVPTYVSGAEAASMAQAVEDLGYGNCTQGAADPNAINEWMAGLERDSYPLQLTFAPPAAIARGTYWVSVAGVDLEADPRVEATVDREANEITITAEGISTLSLWLNDKLADLDRPLKVTVNGVTKEIVTTRNVRSMIDRAFDTGDWARVFTAQADLDVPTTE